MTAGGTRLVNSCVFYGHVGLGDPTDFTITNNYFGATFAADNTNHWASFDGNFQGIPATVSGTTIQAVAGNVTNSYFYAAPPDGTGIANFIKAGFSYDSTISGNVFQQDGVSGTKSAIVQGEGGPINHTITTTYNIVLPSSAGVATLSLGNLDSNNPPMPMMWAVVEHNTIVVGGGNPGIYTGSATSSAIGTFKSLESNIFWGLNTPPTGQYAILEFADPTPKADVLAAANADYNGWYNLATTPAGTWNSVVNPNASDGTIYDVPMSGTTAPGIHDVANVNPDFTDPTRNLQTWDASLGGPGTTASALARIEQDPSLTKTSLLPYIRTGFAPTNPAYKGTAADGGDIGAVPVNVPAAGSAALPGNALSRAVEPSQPTVQSVAQSATMFSSVETAGAAFTPTQVDAGNITPTRGPGGPMALTGNVQNTLLGSRRPAPKLTATLMGPSSQIVVKPKPVAFGWPRTRVMGSIWSFGDGQ